MQRYILQRFVQAIICLLAISVVVFGLVRLTGDPTMFFISESSTQEDYDRIHAQLGLDKPLYIQYGVFLSQVARGDFGHSIFMKRSVASIIAGRLPATLELSCTAMALSLLMALPLGVYAALRRGSLLDLVVRTVAVLGQSMPAFWLGMMLILVFGLYLGVLPLSGRTGPTSVILPAITLGYFFVAGIARLTRSSMLDILDSEYVKLARIKGLSERTVIWKHAFKNAMLPVVTYTSIMFVAMVGGAVVTETVFAWPGIGQLVIQAVSWRDFPLVQGIVLVIAVMYITANLAVDIIYAYLNPKIRYTR